jgi:thiol-disulfide isomerase/thioredoxin
MRGRVVVVNFWASWCEPCMAEMPSLARLSERMKGKPFTVVTVNFAESQEKIDLFLAKTGFALPVVADRQGDAAEAWGVGGLPMSFVLDRAGRVRYRAFGERNWDDSQTVDRIDKLLAEPPHA